MICRFSPFRRPVTARRAAFTLIELLTVIAIILVLAGLLLNVSGNANYKSSVARANTEIQAMSAALENYKADNGTYPRVAYSDKTITSDNLNTQSVTEPSDAKYLASGKVLYQAIGGYTPAGTTPLNKAYMQFRPSQLSTGSAVVDASTYILDPFGSAYGYSTAYAAAQETATANNTALSNPPGYNPTFDLWSTAGYNSNGRSYTKTGLAPAAYNTLWAKNW